MSFIDSASEYLNRGISSAGRGTKTITLKAQLAELDRKGDELYAQLGRKGADKLRGVESFFDDNKDLFDRIDEYTRQRKSMEDELERLKALAELASEQTSAVVCPKCGKRNASGNNFCISCGAKLDTPQQEAPKEQYCPKCGAAVRTGASFCTACGAAINQDVAIAPAKRPPEPDLSGLDVPVTQPTAASTFAVDGTVCPNCGFKNTLGVGFCRMCGTKLA